MIGDVNTAIATPNAVVATVAIPQATFHATVAAVAATCAAVSATFAAVFTANWAACFTNAAVELAKLTTKSLAYNACNAKVSALSAIFAAKLAANAFA